MPVIKSAKKKLRKDRRLTIQNKILKDSFKKLVKKAQKSPNNANLSKAFQIIDKAAKKNIIHKNKAARVKSSLTKLLKTGEKKVSLKKIEKPKKKASAKTSRTKAKK